jgi:hypothetical protein
MELLKVMLVEHHFSLNMWCGFIGDQLIGPCLFLQCLTGDIYTNILQHELPALLKNTPLQTQCQVYQHDGAPPHSGSI